MKNLTTAIKTKFDAAPSGVHNSFYTDMGGRLFKGAAPQSNSSVPYCVYKIIDLVPEYTFCETLEHTRVQFSIFTLDTSSSSIEDYYAHLCSLFDLCSLSVTGETFLKMQRELSRPDVDDEGFWFYIVDYIILDQK